MRKKDEQAKYLFHEVLRHFQILIKYIQKSIEKLHKIMYTEYNRISQPK